MADHSTQQSRPPSNSYPSPHSYPSPSMQPTYAYPPPQQGQGNPEPYRGSPQGSNMSLPPLNLPPIRLQDGQPQQPPQPQHPQHQQHQHQHAQHGQQPMGSPLPPPQHNMPQYYPAHPLPPNQSMGLGGPPHLQMRYQLPPQADQRILSGGRHKKEIKRRTKTGCLTCRKRRIKCDEGHPTCRNCQKSKRDCLGYDPIFKQQPGPAQIQPAPNSAPHQSPVPVSVPPTTATYAGQVPQGYAPAVSTGYVPAVSTSGGSHPTNENFNSSAIDPALAATDPALHGNQPTYNGQHALNPALRGMTATSPYAAAPDVPVVKAKPLRISDIFAIANHHPPDVPQRVTPITPELDDEFEKMFVNDYIAGLDALLETKWFSTNKNAWRRIQSDRSIHEEAIHFLETVKYKTNSADMAGIFSQEARLIWHLLAVCRQTSPVTNGTNGTAPANAEHEDLTLKEVRARLEILEALLTNEKLSANPLHQISYGPDIIEAREKEVAFWQELGNFVVQVDGDSGPGGPVDFALQTMRNVLNSLEVRDCIYSLAIARHFGNRVRGFPNNLPSAIDPNPESDINKLSVAMGFIGYECRSGTQQVIARVCDMAMLSWTLSRAS